VSDAVAAQSATTLAAAAAAADDDDDDDEDDGLLRQSRLLVRLTGSGTIPFTYSADLSLAKAAQGRGGGNWRLTTTQSYQSYHLLPA